MPTDDLALPADSPWLPPGEFDHPAARVAQLEADLESATRVESRLVRLHQAAAFVSSGPSRGFVAVDPATGFGERIDREGLGEHLVAVTTSIYPGSGPVRVAVVDGVPVTAEIRGDHTEFAIEGTEGRISPVKFSHPTHPEQPARRPRAERLVDRLTSRSPTEVRSDPPAIGRRLADQVIDHTSLESITQHIAIVQSDARLTREMTRGEHVRLTGWPKAPPELRPPAAHQRAPSAARGRVALSPPVHEHTLMRGLSR